MRSVYMVFDSLMNPGINPKLYIFEKKVIVVDFI